MNEFKQLEACGQAPWLDYLKRGLIEKGELRTLNARDGLKGVTSDPSIFEKTIGETDEYPRILRTLHGDQIFRIDHFMGKDTVHCTMAFRFVNGLFEPIWNRDRIDHVQIIVAEV